MTLDDVPRETRERLEAMIALVRQEAAVQNLVAASTLDEIAGRHLNDSLQLLPLAPPAGRWLDIGTGAGFPGVVLAIASAAHRFTLAEPRALRAAFLDRMIEHFALRERAAVAQCKVERIAGEPYDIISARAVAPLDRLFGMASHVADERTTWLLPKGRAAREELAAARQTWQGEFRLVPSRTDPDAAILVARGVKRRTKR